MVPVSVLNDALESMSNSEKHGKSQVDYPLKLIKFLLIMQKHGYIGEFEYLDDHHAGKIVTEVNGRSDKCGVNRLHFDVSMSLKYRSKLMYYYGLRPL